MTDVAIESLVKTFGPTIAVDRVSLEIKQGELVTLLGPSGCGKTTLLRIIAGFIEASDGRICLGKTDITKLPPEKRNIGFGFQNYALFPHMTVEQNVAFGLEMRRIPKADITRKVGASLEKVRLTTMAKRLPKQLSGGQQQRVALARALVIEPDLLLLDEPLSNLDAKLRQEMKIEIRALQKSLNITTIFVTHDQDEALSVADRVVLMRDGRVEQDSAPQEIFEAPHSRFVADFMGVANLLAGHVEKDGLFRLEAGDCVKIPATLRASQNAVLALRPELIELCISNDLSCKNQIEATVEGVAYRGLVVDYRVRTKSGLALTSRRPSPALGGDQLLQPGAQTFASWKADDGFLLST